MVSPDGAFIYRQYTGWINADDEVCLNVLMPDSSAYIIPNNPTVASVGYNATYVWRTAWYVYTDSYGRGVVVGRGVVKAWAVDPATLDKKMLLGQWPVDLRNGYVTYTTSIPLSWPNQFVGMELCFVPYYSASYVVGANATLGFRKNAIPSAGGTYFLGISPVDRSQNVGGAVFYYLLNPPVRNLVFGPFSLVDGYYGQTLNLDMTVYVPWSTSTCPTLTVTTYVGELAQFSLDSASFAASRYVSITRECIYEVRRSVMLSPDAVGLWYDEARARDKAVAIKVSFSLPVSELIIYRVDISGRRFAENYIDKNVFQWQGLIFRGFISQTTRYCGSARLPQVNGTVVLTNIETYSMAAGDVMDYLAVVRGAPSDYVIDAVRFRVRPAEAFVGVGGVYVKGYTYQEPWWLTWAFRVAQVVKSAADFFGLIPGPLSWFIDRVFDLQRATQPDIQTSTTAEYVEVYWRPGIYDKIYQVAFKMDVSRRDRVIEVVDVEVAGDYRFCMFSPVAVPMPVVAPPSLYNPQLMRHWIFGMRVTNNVPFADR